MLIDTKIYLASPYSHEFKAIRQERFEAICKFSAKLIKEGYLVFSPIAHSHNICTIGNLPSDFNYWEKLDRSFIEWCDILVVLKLEGWQNSKGIEEEISTAKFLGKNVIYLEILES